MHLSFRLTIITFRFPVCQITVWRLYVAKVTSTFDGPVQRHVLVSTHWSLNCNVEQMFYRVYSSNHGNRVHLFRWT